MTLWVGLQVSMMIEYLKKKWQKMKTWVGLAIIQMIEIFKK